MNSSQIRAEARKKLTSKWGKAAIITLVYAVISYIISLVLGFIPFIGSIVSMLISVPLSFGFVISMCKLNDDAEVGYLDFLTNGFSNFGRAWSTGIWTFIKLIIPIVLVMITAGIFGYGIFTGKTIITILGLVIYIVALIYAVIKSLSYSLALFILNDNADMDGKQAVEKSSELMQNKVSSLFCLNFSFIGWFILATFTIGIGFLWVLPYMYISQINFYRNLTTKSDSAE